MYMDADFHLLTLFNTESMLLSYYIQHKKFQCIHSQNYQFLVEMRQGHFHFEGPRPLPHGLHPDLDLAIHTTDDWTAVSEALCNVTG
jgi:hypothetical protein